MNKNIIHKKYIRRFSYPRFLIGLIKEIDYANRFTYISFYLFPIFRKDLITICTYKKSFCIFYISFLLIFFISKSSNPNSHITIFMKIFIVGMIIIKTFIYSINFLMYPKICINF